MKNAVELMPTKGTSLCGRGTNDHVVISDYGAQQFRNAFERTYEQSTSVFFSFDGVNKVLVRFHYIIRTT